MLAFLSKGNGGTEAAHLLGLLGLPNSTTMAGRSFHSVEKCVGPVVIELAEETTNNNLVEAVHLNLGGKRNNNGTLLFDVWKQHLLPKEQWPRLTTSADMGWQGRSTAAGTRWTANPGMQRRWKKRQESPSLGTSWLVVAPAVMDGREDDTNKNQHHNMIVETHGMVQPAQWNPWLFWKCTKSHTMIM